MGGRFFCTIALFGQVRLCSNTVRKGVKISVEKVQCEVFTVSSGHEMGLAGRIGLNCALAYEIDVCREGLEDFGVSEVGDKSLGLIR